MATQPAYLIIGGDSLVGGGVVDALKRRGHRVFASSRRPGALAAGRVHFDFERPETFQAPDGATCAMIIAAATNYERCEKDPLARKINVELVPQTAAALLEQGLFVTFISTNSVFGGERPWPQEDDPHAPGIAYALQKSEGEASIRRFAEQMGVTNRLNIVRLTKIMNAGVSPLPAWFSAWQRGEAVEPFTDLIFAPMSVTFVGKALAAIAEMRVAGNLHLSGAENITYLQFAKALAARFGIGESLIRPTTAVAKGVHIPFKPTYSGLGMARTTSLTGVRPQQLGSLVDDIAADRLG